MRVAIVSMLTAPSRPMCQRPGVQGGTVGGQEPFGWWVWREVFRSLVAASWRDVWDTSPFLLSSLPSVTIRALCSVCLCDPEQPCQHIPWSTLLSSSPVVKVFVLRKFMIPHSLQWRKRTNTGIKRYWTFCVSKEGELHVEPEALLQRLLWMNSVLLVHG